MTPPRDLRTAAAAFATVFALTALTGCATSKAPAPAPTPAPEAAAPEAGTPAATPTVRPTPGPPGPAVPVPRPAAPSGTLFRVGLKSDLPQFGFGPPGSPWVLVSEGRAERRRGPLTFVPEDGASARYAAQAGAFSQEETAKAVAARLSAEQKLPVAVAFSADRGLYRVLLGDFAARADAAALVERLKAAGQEALVAEGPSAAAAATVLVTDEAGAVRRFASPVDVFPDAAGLRVVVDGTVYRGSLRVLVSSRGTLNVVNRVDMEEYLYGVVPAEMGPKRFDELEALKAQAVAARTYAFAHKGQFETEGYDLCATPKCQVYAGQPAEDPLSTAAVDSTRGLVLAFGGRFADALFVSTCGGRTENVENVFGEDPVPYLVSVPCGELATTRLDGARLPRGEKSRARSGLEWRGYVLGRHVPHSAAPRGAALEAAQGFAGIARRGGAPASLEPSAVYPSLIESFGLKAASREHLVPETVSYDDEEPAASASLTPPARDAYDFLLRFRFGGGEALPPPDRKISEEEYRGLLFSAALRLSGVSETAGRFLSREGSNLWVKTADGRVGLPVDPELPLARRVGDFYLPSPSLTLRAGDRIRWWKRGPRLLALWVELDTAGPTFDRESAWTEWVRRVSGTELARRMGGRVAGSEVRDVTVTKRSAAGRAVELRVRTDVAETTLRRFDLRQALGLPELLFTVERVQGAQGEIEFVFLGRGWGHGVGLCQNGSFGMALSGQTYDQILKHYYTGIDIVPASGVTAGPPSTR
ncbi:MAG TPA: SpoIID/LytB domain-containing protein [Thermoanaerobaculia bacterium]|nr:SpoIID/LytB domain-containing protein [Thermoanaerobaculia bacterium]